MWRPGRRSREGGWVAGAVVLVVVLRVPYASVPFGVDEGGLAYVASRWEAGAGSLYGAHWLDRPPLLLALFRLAVPAEELGVRALGALAAIALVVLAAATGRALAGDRAARTAAILAAALAGSVALMAAYAPAELLAAVPSADAMAAALLEMLDARDVSFLIADVSGRSLNSLGHTATSAEPGSHSEETSVRVALEGTPYGAALAGQRSVLLREGDDTRVLAPVTSRGEAVRVLELVLPFEPAPITVETWSSPRTSWRTW